MLNVGWMTAAAGLWRSDEEDPSRPVRLPVPAYLDETEREQILIDTGLHPGAADGHQSVRIGDLVLGVDVAYFASGLDDHRFPAFADDRFNAPLFLTLAQSQLRTSAGMAVKINFAATLAGQTTLTASPGNKLVRRKLAKAGSGSLSLKLTKPGHYRLRLQLTAADGQKRSVNGKLVVSGG